MLLIITIALFALAAILGLYLISFILTNKETRKGVAFIHGSIAGLGIICLLIAALKYQPNLWVSVTLFILAALGGFYMMIRDITGKTLPKWLALGHGLIAVCSFVILLTLVFIS